MKKLTVKIMDTQDCIRVYQKRGMGNIFEGKQLCAGGEEGKCEQIHF